MLRGIMTLSQQEIVEAIAIIKEQYSDTPLYHKLTSSTQSSEAEVGVQVSNEELEILLDNIGVPSDSESDARKSLRLRVQDFLAKLRHVE